MSNDQLTTAATIVLIIAGGWLAHRVLRRIIKRTVSGLQGERAQRGMSLIRKRTPNALLNTHETTSLRRAQRAETIGGILRSISTVAIVVIVIFAILGQLEINLGPLVAGTAVLTAALAFGAQNIVRDFLAGFFIVIEDQYGVGDVIDLGAASGKVEFVSLRITQLRNADGTLWHVPNGEIKRVGNKSQTWSRAVVEMRVNLDTDINRAIQIMKDVADDMWHDSAYTGVITDEPDIWAPDAIDSDGILLKLAVKTRPLEQWQVARTLRSRIKNAYDEAGIRISSSVPDTYATPPVSGN